MCGIVGYLGKCCAKEKCMEMLKKLEYRGYDSSGLCLKNNDEFYIRKSVGKILNLENKIKNENVNSCIGIAHTRWATHGIVNEINAHPHITGNWCIVHNGIIENYKNLINENNFKMNSETDSEIISQLLQKENKIINIEKIINVFKKLNGSYACLIINNFENKIYVAKNKSPIYLGINNNEIFIASDVVAFSKYVNYFYSLDDGEFAEISSNEIIFYNSFAKTIKKQKKTVDLLQFDNDKSNFKYYMEKEINEIPNKIIDLKNYYINNKFIVNSLKNINLSKVKYIYLIGCGSAFHSALFGKKFIENQIKKNVKVVLASEFFSSDIKPTKNSLCFFVSQSGETADTLKCLEYCKNKKCKNYAITNVLHSTLAQNCDVVFPICAGVEIGVASTKAYVCQIIVLIIISKLLSKISMKNYNKFLSKNLEKLSLIIKNNLAYFSKKSSEIADKILQFKKVLFLGKSEDCFSALEASLKLKEISYLPCLAISSGELKHGSIALIDENSISIIISTNKNEKVKNENAEHEINARSGETIFVSPFYMQSKNIILPKTKKIFYPILSIIPLQLLALSSSIKLGNNPDMPRNLAKSVTVE